MMMMLKMMVLKMKEEEKGIFCYDTNDGSNGLCMQTMHTMTIL